MLFGPKEKGQGLIEFAVAFALLVILIVAIMNLGKNIRDYIPTPTPTP